MAAVPNFWMPRLASAIAAALREFGVSRLQGQSLIILDVGCFPWHGQLELSVLTTDQLELDPALSEPGEQAAWPHYNFTAGLASWNAARELGRRMREAYSDADPSKRATIADEFLQACAEAVSSPEVASVLALFQRDLRFRISVTHPDDGRQFCPSSAR